MQHRSWSFCQHVWEFYHARGTSKGASWISQLLSNFQNKALCVQALKLLSTQKGACLKPANSNYHRTCQSLNIDCLRQGCSCIGVPLLLLWEAFMLPFIKIRLPVHFFLGLHSIVKHRMRLTCIRLHVTGLFIQACTEYTVYTVYTCELIEHWHRCASLGKHVTGLHMVHIEFISLQRVTKAA